MQSYFNAVHADLPFTQLIPGVPSITRDEIQRLLEDKDFDSTDLRDLLGTELTDIKSGLSQALSYTER